MYLKRLDVAGFKSFATRTAFEFGQGLTAIVGPNGSGKSNVSDALRWVLGEQSGRLLRARKLEDVIFAGSSKRPPADKAEVTLTLDNSAGWLPLDFSEVAISRRAYRSGESDYLINRKRVRLRDVQDLLMRASAPSGARMGAGQNSYAIIGQGLVETVLNLRPEERRQLVEEAADIQRYRLKIEEAQNKLAATRENTERVKLLIKEIAPRLGHLERQAKRAAEHSRLSRELGQALQVWYEHQWHHAQEALTVARAGHDQAQAEHTQARVALETCQRELTSISEELDQRRAAVSASAAQRQSLSDRVHELEQSLALNQQRRGILQARKQELEEELKALEGERKVAASSVFDDAERRSELEERVAEARRSLEEQNRALAGLEEEFRGMQAQAGAAEEKAARLRAGAGDVKARAQRLTYSQGDLGKDANRMDTRRRSLINQMAEVVRVLRNIRRQEAEFAEGAAGFGRRREALDLEREETRKSLAHLEANQHARRAKLEALQALLNVLEEAQQQYRRAEAEEPASRSVMVEGLQAAIHDIIRVPRGLETAIEAALADYVEALVVNHQKEAIAAAQAIAAQGGNRSFIIPLDSVKEVYPLNILRERNVVGVASHLVKCDNRYRRTVDALLGRVIVVQDVDTAVRVLRRGMGTVVTMDGVVFHPVGSVSAGWPKASRPFILGHERDLEAIPKEVDRVRRSLEVTEGQIGGLRASLAEQEGALTGLAQEQEALLQKRLRTQEAVAERQQRLAQLRGEMRGLMAALDRIREQGQSFLQEAERLKEERESLVQEAAEADESAKYLRKSIAMVDSRREAILHSVTDASAQVATAEGELRSIAQMREQSEAAVARLDAQLQAKRVQVRGLELELSSLAESLRLDQDELEKARSQLQEVADSYDPERETIAQSEARERELHSQLLTLQSRLLDAERRVLETEADVRRWETELATLRQHLEDDGLTITDAGDVVVPGVISTQIPYWLAAQPDQPEPPGGPRPIAGGAQVDPQALGQQIEKLRGQIRQLGPVNIEAQIDYQQLRERHDFLSAQMDDLHGAERSLHRAINELTDLMHKRFEATFGQVAEGFEQYFQAFFGGGHARLVLTDGENLNTAGVDISAQPPGKRLQSLAQLSGGEKALTAVALLFALLQTSPSPFCVLDEVDAMLDDANVGRFVAALQELAKRTQFVVITHNRKTIEVSDAIYGVSMGLDSASRVLSLRLADLPAGRQA